MILYGTSIQVNFNVFFFLLKTVTFNGEIYKQLSKNRFGFKIKLCYLKCIYLLSQQNMPGLANQCNLSAIQYLNSSTLHSQRRYHCLVYLSKADTVPAGRQHLMVTVFCSVTQQEKTIKQIALSDRERQPILRRHI